MRRTVIYKISGIVIVLFWLFVLAELVRRTNFSPSVDLTHIGEKMPLDEIAEEWMEIFVRGHKVGYTVTRIKKIERGFEVREQIFLAVDLMGSAQEILSNTRAQLDKRFLLNSFDFSLSSGLIEFKTSGRIRGNNLQLSVGEKGKGEKRLLRLPSRPMISAGMRQFFRSCKLKIGDSFTFPVFDPITMTTNPIIIKVAAREVIGLDGKSYKAFRMEMDFLGRPLVFWLDEKGASLKEKGFMGLTLVRSTPAKAKLGLDRSKRVDFSELSAIRVSKKIKDPRGLSYLMVQLNQVPSSLPIDGSRQSLSGKILAVEKEGPPFKAPYTIPYRGNDNNLLNHLMPETLIQSEDPEIITLAKRIVDETADPFMAAELILGWVFENLEKTPVVSIPDAREILKHRKGDCNEHATILTALLRASGIPARIVVGVVYKDGRFYYHAWNEAYINKWISMDATLKQMPVDATHIKLIDGGVEKQIQIVGMIGTLEFSILDYQ
ncbi:MAG: lasso peptide biosynthesis protein [Deltaproteobacteria bacterium]|nr:MAG: lasso peptide biosynthesis protein [Deltaproteobacteria bacterium]